MNNIKFSTTWHILHLIMTLLTGGLWTIVWIICWSMNAKKNKMQEWRLQREQTEAILKMTQQNQSIEK